MPDCIKSLNKNKIIFLRNPNFNRPWQHVLEPLNGYLILGMKLFYFTQKNIQVLGILDQKKYIYKCINDC